MPDCSFKICEKPSNFSESVRVVLSDTVPAWSTTTPSPCPCSQWLCQHLVFVVNNYFSRCLCSQRLRRQGVSIVNDYADIQCSKISNFILFTFLSTTTQTHVSIVNDYTDTCFSCSHWLRWHTVRIVNDYADTCFSQISLRKQNILLNRFCMFNWGPGGVFWQKVSKNLVTLSL